MTHGHHHHSSNAWANFHLAVATAPGDPVVVPLADLKKHLRIVHTDDDAMIADLEQSAVLMAETYTRRVLLESTLVRTMERFPRARKPIYLYRPPFTSLTKIDYADADGDPQQLLAADVQQGIHGKVPFLVPGIDEDWPDTQVGNINAVTVEYVAGWADAAAVPQVIKLAIKQLVAHWYEFAEPVIAGTTAGDLPFQVRALLNKERVWEVR